MKPNDAEEDIRSIKILMERSSKFISLSGLSGVLAGIYALVGAWFAYQVLYPAPGFYWGPTAYDYLDLVHLAVVAVTVLVLAIGTGIWLTARKAKKRGQRFWNPSSRGLLASMSIPLLTGGTFILIMLYHGYYGIMSPACLIFYGLSLIAGSHYTFGDIKWLGIFEILLGLTAALFPGFGLLFWATGFGFLHILYGSIMYFKYDR